MSEYNSRPPGSHDELIGRLTSDITPIRRLKPPLVRATIWLAAPIILLMGLLTFYGYRTVTVRLMEAPDLWLAAGGAALTAVFAGLSAFELSVPGSSARWTLLPVPALCLWVGASGMGCLRTWSADGFTIASLYEAGDCFLFIVTLSLPLSALLFVMLRRNHPLRPNLIALIGGLACAAAAATLLNVVHPYDAAITDLTVHLLALIVVMATCRLASGKLNWAKIKP